MREWTGPDRRKSSAAEREAFALERRRQELAHDERRQNGETGTWSLAGRLADKASPGSIARALALVAAILGGASGGWWVGGGTTRTVSPEVSSSPQPTIEAAMIEVRLRSLEEVVREIRAQVKVLYDAQLRREGSEDHGRRQK